MLNKYVISDSQKAQRPEIIHSLKTYCLMTGITVFDNKIYVTKMDVSQVDVFQPDTFEMLNPLTVDGLCSPYAIVSCEPNRCLFISDTARQVIHRVEFPDKFTRWSIEDESYGLSVTNSFNLLVTLYNTPQLIEYTPDGTPVRTVDLPENCCHPIHSIQVDDDTFLVCHGWYGDNLHRVCKINSCGEIKSKYRYKRSFRDPTRLFLDKFGNVLVSCMDKGTVTMLDPSLAFVGNLVSSRSGLQSPYRMYLDEGRGQLYVAHNKINVLTNSTLSVIALKVLYKSCNKS